MRKLRKPVTVVITIPIWLEVLAPREATASGFEQGAVVFLLEISGRFPAVKLFKTNNYFQLNLVRSRSSKRAEWVNQLNSQLQSKLCQQIKGTHWIFPCFICCIFGGTWRGGKFPESSRGLWGRWVVTWTPRRIFCSCFWGIVDLFPWFFHWKSCLTVSSRWHFFGCYRRFSPMTRGDVNMIVNSLRSSFACTCFHGSQVVWSSWKSMVDL